MKVGALVGEVGLDQMRELSSYDHSRVTSLVTYLLNGSGRHGEAIVDDAYMLPEKFPERSVPQ